MITYIGTPKLVLLIVHKNTINPKQSLFWTEEVPSNRREKLLESSQSFWRPLERPLGVDDDGHEVLVVVRSHVVQSLVDTLVVTETEEWFILTREH